MVLLKLTGWIGTMMSRLHRGDDGLTEMWPVCFSRNWATQGNKMSQLSNSVLKETIFSGVMNVRRLDKECKGRDFSFDQRAQGLLLSRRV